jgi:antibiotic biosynthesis monooxygenase (ABM) superfamily enzyme
MSTGDVVPGYVDRDVRPSVVDSSVSPVVGGGSVRNARPSRYKLAVVTWLAAYPTITAILASFKPLGLITLPLPVRTLLLTLIMVPTVAFFLVPLFSRALGGWLRR